MRRAALVLALPLTVLACIGQIGDPPDGVTVVEEPLCGEVLRPGPAPVRRMTRFEYNNTVRDLLGDDTSPASDFGAEEEALGFNNNAANLVTSSALAEKYMVAAEGISARDRSPLEERRLRSGRGRRGRLRQGVYRELR